MLFIVTPPSRDRLIKEFTDNIKEFQQHARNIAGADDADDLFQECALMLLEFPEERLQGYWNPKEGLKPFWLRLLCNQYKSKTSKFHKEYRKTEEFIRSKGADVVYNRDIELREEEEIDFNEVVAARDNVYRLNGELFPSELEDMVFAIYTETGSLRKTLAAIPEEHASKFDLKRVHTIVKKFRRTIKNRLKVAA